MAKCEVLLMGCFVVGISEVVVVIDQINTSILAQNLAASARRFRHGQVKKDVQINPEIIEDNANVNSMPISGFKPWIEEPENTKELKIFCMDNWTSSCYDFFPETSRKGTHCGLQTWLPWTKLSQTQEICHFYSHWTFNQAILTQTHKHFKRKVHTHFKRKIS